MTRCRAILNQLAFKAGNSSRSVIMDQNKPLSVPAGTDSLAQIGAPPTIHEAQLSARRPEDIWQAALQHFFPPGPVQSSAMQVMPEDPATKAEYAELVIDELRLQKEEELVRYRRHAERQAKELAIRLKVAASPRPGSNTQQKQPQIASSSR